MALFLDFILKRHFLILIISDGPKKSLVKKLVFTYYPSHFFPGWLHHEAVHVDHQVQDVLLLILFASPAWNGTGEIVQLFQRLNTYSAVILLYFLRHFVLCTLKGTFPLCRPEFATQSFTVKPVPSFLTWATSSKFRYKLSLRKTSIFDNHNFEKKIQC